MKKTSKILALLLTIAMVLTLVPAMAIAAEPANYAKITTADELVTGEYALVLDNGYALDVLDGSWVLPQQPTITEETITANVWTLTVTDSGVKLTDSNGVSIAPKGGNNNGIKEGDYEWAVSCADGKFQFAGTGSDTVILAGNTTATGANRFRGYKTATVTGSPDTYPCYFNLYKIVEETTEPVPSEEPTEAPTEEPTEEPTEAPTEEPTEPVAAPLPEFEIAAEWIWGSTIAEAGVDGAEKIVSRCAEMGITDIYLLVKGTGGGLSWLNTEFPQYLSRTDRDVMQETIDACRAHGLRIHAWICNGQDSNYKADHPEAGQWHYVRERDNDNIALYNEGYVEYMKKIVAEIAAYDVDGIHLDYIRYNHLANGWSETDLANMEAMGGNIDNIKYIINKTFYSQFLPEGETVDGNYAFDQYNAGNPDAVIIAQYRRNVVNTYAKTIIEAAKAVNPNLIITAALQPETAYDHAFGGLHYGNNFADCPELYDYIVPMAYSNVFGKDASWMVQVAEASIDQGNPVVMGLNSYYGNNGVTSQLLMADIEAVRGMLNDEAYAEKVLGICHFRNTQFGYAKVSYNLTDKSMTVKTINANPAYNYAWVQIELQEGLVAKAATLVEGYAPTTQIEIAEDGSYVRYSGTDILMGDCEGTLTLAYEGDLDVSKPAALVRIYMTNESRAYNVYVDATNETVVKNGVIAENGGLYYYENGQIVPNAGAIRTEGGYYYYIGEEGKPVAGTVQVADAKGVLIANEYVFNAPDGRVDATKHGPVAENDGIYFYLGNHIQYALGLVEFEGDYYYVRSNGQVATGEYWITNANDLLKEGFYFFAPSGKAVLGNGIVDVDGDLYYVINDAVQYGAGLVEVDGNIYYVRSNGICAIGEYYVSNTNELKDAGFYTFDDNGILMELDGIVEVDGTLYYYQNGTVQFGAGLIEIEGSYYYIRSNGACAIGEYWVTNTNDLMEEGLYTFGADGKMVL